jgi:hypothetical protein
MKITNNLAYVQCSTDENYTEDESNTTNTSLFQLLIKSVARSI